MTKLRIFYNDYWKKAKFIFKIHAKSAFFPQFFLVIDSEKIHR